MGEFKPTNDPEIGRRTSSELTATRSALGAVKRALEVLEYVDRYGRTKDPAYEFIRRDLLIGPSSRSTPGPGSRGRRRRTPMTEMPCELWTGAKYGTGYGKKWVDGKWMLAHRWAFREYHGYLPEVVRHECDTPLCIEETHLLPGDQGDNIRDAVKRKRYSRMGDKCKRGHSRWGWQYDGSRRCLECKRIQSAEYRRRGRVDAGARAQGAE